MKLGLQKPLLCFLAALLANCAGLSKIEEQRNQEGLETSFRMFEAGKYDSSIASAAGVAGNSKAKPSALMMEAFSYSRLGAWDSASAKLTQCAGKAGKGSLESDISSLFLGYLAYDLKPTPDLVAAATHFNRIGKASPLFDEASLALGWSFVKVQQMGTAYAYFGGIIKGKTPSYFEREARYGACIIRYFEKKFVESVFHCDEALKPRRTAARFGTSALSDSAYDQRHISREALQVRWSVKCVMEHDKDSSSCIKARELNGTSEPVALLEWQSGRKRILEDIDAFSGSIVKHRISRPRR